MPYRSAISCLAVAFSAALLAGLCSADDNEGEQADKKPQLNKVRIDELTESIKSMPDEPKNYRLRAFEYAKGETWDKAAADYVQLAKLREGNSQIGQQIGVFLVLAGDKKTHETLCKEMIAGFKDSADRGNLERTVKICTLPTEPVGKLEDLLTMSRKSVEIGAGQDFACHHYRTLALVLYRMKKYDEAIEAVQAGDKADAAARFQIPNVIVCNRALEAMCLHRQGKTDEAKKVLAKATPTLEEQFKDPDMIYQDEFWHDWLIAKVLYEEAEGVLAKGEE